MKYGNIAFSGKEINNLGDQMQIIALNNMYDRLNIPESERVIIPFSELSTYSNNEKVILPISFPILTYNPMGVCGLFSNDIIPLFIGFTWLNPIYSEEEISYLKQYEPIGCRDEYTRNNLLKCGIKAYLNGCITLSAFFDCADCFNTHKRTKVYLVDVEDSFLKYIPVAIKTKAEIRSQYVRAEKGKDIYQIAQQRYKEYNDNARLVITSRLHCAIPCISMGIPVIILREKVSYRFSWVEKIAPIYTHKTIEKVDWNPKPVQCKEIIRMQCEVFADCIFHRVSNNYALLDDCLINREKISDYYIDGITPALEYLSIKENQNKPYILWGGSIAAKCIYDVITKNYHNMKLKRLIDKYNIITIGDNESCSYLDVSNKEWEEAAVFITALAANKEAESLFKSIGKSNDFIYCYY